MTAISGSSAGAAQQISTAYRATASAAKALSTGRSQDAINISDSGRISRAAAVAQAGVSNGQLNHAKANVAADSLDQVGQVLERMQGLALRASSGDLNAGDRQVLNTEAQALTTELGEILDNTKFNGKALFDGATSTAKVDGQVTTTNADGAAIKNPLAGIDLSTQAGAQAAVGQVADAQAALALEQTKVATGAARMGRATRLAQGKASHLSEAASSIGSANIAKEVANFVAGQVQAKASARVAKSLHKMEADVVATLLG